MATINVPGEITAGQAVNIDATGLNAADGDSFTWNTSQGSSFSPNPSNVSGGTTSTTYTPGAAGTDTVSGSDSDPTDNASTDVVISASGGGGGGGSNPALTNASVIAAQAAMAQVQDFTSTAACGPVKAFQSAWNAAGGTPSLTVDGGYGTETSAASGAVAQANGLGGVQGGLSGGWPNCGGGVTPPNPNPNPNPIQPASSSSKWWLWLLGAVAVAGVAALAYWAFATPSGKATFGMASEKKRKGKKKKAKKAKKRSKK